MVIKGNNKSRPQYRLLVVGLSLLLVGSFIYYNPSNSPSSLREISGLESPAASKAPPAKEKKPMGYTKEVIKEGNGQKPEKGQYVTVHCTGYGKNRDMNLKFWSTKDPGQQPFTFRVGMGEVIKAWDESVLTMSIGEISKIVATPDYAYGASGFPAWGIMPNSDLAFEIEILKYSYTAS